MHAGKTGVSQQGVFHICELSVRGLTILYLTSLILIVGSLQLTFAAVGSSSKPFIIAPHLSVEAVYEGLSFPTAMSFLGPNDILVLEKDTGQVKRIINGIISDPPFLDVSVSTKGERGMLGIAINVQENYSNGNIFLYYTESATSKDDYNNEPLGNRLYRYALQNNSLSNPEVLLDVPSYSPTGTGYHNGGKLLVDPDENLYLVVGDMDRHSTKSQNVNENLSLGTSIIYKINHADSKVSDVGFDGELLNDNIYAYGIRNSFGLDIDPLTGKLWDTENGPGYGDEVNLVEPGFNSGWKQIQGLSSLKEGFKIENLVNLNGKGKYSDPEFVWNQTVGPTAIKFLNSDKYGKAYENDILVGDINNGNIYHFDLNEERTELDLKGALQDKIANTPEEAESAIFGKGFGGITDIQVGPDGYIYVISHGSLFRILPFD
jgi:glucose/arabinose dehydrogenase